jgi:GNAT superfamily N-acetyltransferase
MAGGHAGPVGDTPPDPTLRIIPRGAGAICRDVLATLPTWFGIPESVLEYIGLAEANPTVVASDAMGDVGLLTLVTFGRFAAEIAVMGVVPRHHRAGIGRAMLVCAESWLADRGVEFLQVKTLSPRSPDPGYAKTRAFYEACGFRPLEEFPELWGAENPALQMIKAVGRR